MTPAFETFLGFLATIGTLTYLTAQWRSGRLSGKGISAQTAADTIALLKTRADTFEQGLKEAKAEIAAQHDEIIRLQEANKHKDAQIEQYLGIISNRNPDLEKTLGDVRNFLEQLNKKIGNANQLVIDAAHTAG